MIQASAQTGQGVEQLRQLIKGKFVAFTGNTGVGKSSMLNALCPELNLATGEVSEKLGRGRHTTRHVQLYCLGDDTYVADTPGFSSFDTEQMDVLLKENPDETTHDTQFSLFEDDAMNTDLWETDPVTKQPIPKPIREYPLIHYRRIMEHDKRI